MPYITRCVKAARFCQIKGVIFYHTYKDDDCENNPPSSYYFTIHPYGSTEYALNVRNLPNWREDPNTPPFLTGKGNTPENRRKWDLYHEKNMFEAHVREVLREALTKNLLVIYNSPDDENWYAVKAKAAA